MKKGALIGGLIVALLTAAFYVPALCHIRWSGTGYETKYSYFSGCLVQQASGKWLPEDKVRPE